MLMLGIILMIPSIGIAAEKTDPILRDKGQEIREGALASTNGDTTKAFIVVSDKTAQVVDSHNLIEAENKICLLYTSPSPRDRTRSRMPSSA